MSIEPNPGPMSSTSTNGSNNSNRSSQVRKVSLLGVSPNQSRRESVTASKMVVSGDCEEGAFSSDYQYNVYMEGDEG